MSHRSQRQRRRSSEQGYVLLVFSLFAALMLIGLYRIMPVYVFQGQRMKEEELIFRGQEYRRAIQLFVRKFGRYPASLEELENTNQIRFIRKLYPDPMAADGEWRLIHIGPDGTFFDPENQGSQSQQSGEQEKDPFSRAASRTGEETEGDDPATQATASPGANPGLQPRGSGAVQQQRPPLSGGGGIAGVASKNEAVAIKVLNGFTHYNEWEFVFDYTTDQVAQDTVKRMFGGNQPQTPFTPGQPGATTPPQTPMLPGNQGPSGLGFSPGFRPFPGVPSQPGAAPGTAPGTAPPTWNSPRQPSDPFQRR